MTLQDKLQKAYQDAYDSAKTEKEKIEILERANGYGIKIVIAKPIHDIYNDLADYFNT